MHHLLSHGMANLSLQYVWLPDAVAGGKKNWAEARDSTSLAKMSRPVCHSEHISRRPLNEMADPAIAATVPAWPVGGGCY